VRCGWVRMSVTDTESHLEAIRTPEVKIDTYY